jgi:hypothetical protein
MQHLTTANVGPGGRAKLAKPDQGLAVPLMAYGRSTDPEQVPPGDEPDDGAVGAPQDRHAPRIGFRHAIGQLPH